MEAGIVYSTWTFECREIAQAAARKGIALELIREGELALSLGNGAHTETGFILMRSLSHSRSIYEAMFFEKAGLVVINPSDAIRTCGDKGVCSLELSASGIRMPKTRIAFEPEQAKKAARELGYPCVIKPVVGSWGRLVQRINDDDAAETAIGCREVLGSPMQKIYYLQEFVASRGRDIRIFVCGNEPVAAMYRYAQNGKFACNIRAGGSAEPCEISDELVELAAKVIGAVGEGVFGIDAIEGADGLCVLEVNPTPEFMGIQQTTHTKIADKILEYAVKTARE
ncbi:MAG: RimK family alpha-L-glutamate ligase [Candidatus Micrarchaeota archaeon]